MNDQPTDQQQQPQQPAQPQQGFEFVGSRNFTGWLAGQQCSLAFTTYNVGKIFFIGLNAEGQMSIFERTFERSMGMWSNGQTLYLSSLYQFWRFENAIPEGQQHSGYDRLYVPQVGYVTGDIDVHDIAPDHLGRPVFVNTLFSCLATVSETHSFVPLWHPPFISRLAAEDRCHLNGLAMGEDGKPAYVTAVATSDVADGWREHRAGGGVVIDVKTGDVVLDGLSMPHSPRLYRGRLYLHDSGTGRFGYADLESGKFEEIAFCPGYLRGLAFAGDYAVVGLSRPRQNKTFQGLALDEALAAKSAEARSGLQMINLATGDASDWLRAEGLIEELYDVAVLPNVRRPMALGFRTDEIRRTLSLADPQPL